MAKIVHFDSSLLWLLFVIGYFTNDVDHGNLEEETYIDQPSRFVAMGSMAKFVNVDISMD